MTIFTIPEAGTHECFGQVLRHIGKPRLLLFYRLVNQCTKRQKNYGVGKFYSIQPLVFYYLKKCQWFKAFTVAQWLKFITLYTDTLLTTHCDNPGAAICLACTGAGTVPEALQMPPARCQEGAGQPRAARATDSSTSALSFQAQTPSLAKRTLRKSVPTQGFMASRCALGSRLNPSWVQLAAPRMRSTWPRPAWQGASVLGTESLRGSLNCAFESAKVRQTKHRKLTQIKKKKQTAVKPKNAKP